MWLASGVIFLASFISLRPYTPEHVIRLTGLLLQLLGIGTVIWGISETRALFKRPSFAAKIKSWFKRFPLLRRDVVISAGPATLAIAGGAASISITVEPRPNPTIETRVEAIEKNLTLIYERISSIEKEMDEFRKAAEALINEEKARQTVDRGINEKLESAGTGGIHISAIGALWLFVGVILSTASIEIADLLK